MSQRYAVDSIIRSAEKREVVEQAGARAVVLSVEDDDAASFSNAFKGARAVVWSAGAGGKGGPERTRAVDHHGAVKVFDAVEQLEVASRPRVLVVSALGVRDTSKPPPAHWTDADKERMDKSYKALGAYCASLCATELTLQTPPSSRPTKISSRARAFAGRSCAVRPDHRAGLMEQLAD